MGGGGGGDTVTNTYTGLGDDQFANLQGGQGTIQENQANIAGSIDTARTDADAAYQNIYNRFNQSRERQDAMASAIGSKGQRFDFTPFGEGLTLNDSLSALKQATGLQDQDLKYDVNGDGVVDQRDAEGMMSNIVGLDPNTVDTGLYKEFADQNKNLTDQFGNVTTQFGDLTRDLGQQAVGIKAGQGQLLSDLSTRFDDVDTGLGTNLDAIGGVSDQVTDVQTTADTIDSNTENLGSDLDTLATNQTRGFEGVGDTLDTGFGDASEERGDIADAADEGRGEIIDDLDQLGRDQGTYYDDLAGTLGDVEQTTDQYVSDFDDYIDRYSDDVDQAVEERSGILTGTEQELGRLRDDLGEYTQAVSGYASDTDETIRDESDLLGDTVVGGFSDIERSLGTGFADTQDVIGEEVEGLDLQTRLDNVVDSVGGDLSRLDADIAAQFGGVAEAFNDQGDLITDQIADNGDVITRALDDQGNLVEQRFDAQGQLLGQTETNLNDALSAVERSLGIGMETMGDDMSTLFDVQNATLSDQGSQLLTLGMNMDGLSDQQKTEFQAISGAFDAQGNLIRTGQDAMGNLVEREMDASGNLIERKFDDQGNMLDQTSLNVNDVMSGLSQLDTIQGSIQQGFAGVQDEFSAQEGIMAEMGADQRQQMADTQAQITTGFDATSNTMDTQIRDLAGVASQMGDLDMDMRQQFYQLDASFDDNGELIRNTIDDNGNTIQRSIDTNGNILLRAFDDTGQSIGQNVININRALGDLADLENMPGANISMGNLSPALQADPRADQPNVPTSGFMAPYTETR